MDDRAEFLPLAVVIEALESAHRRASTAQATLGVFRLSMELPIFVEERGPDTFVRFPRASDSSASHALSRERLKISIGPEGNRHVSVEPLG